LIFPLNWSLLDPSREVFIATVKLTPMFCEQHATRIYNSLISIHEINRAIVCLPISVHAVRQSYNFLSQAFNEYLSHDSVVNKRQRVEQRKARYAELAELPHFNSLICLIGSIRRYSFNGKKVN
jgi:hypothetical protein